MIRYIKNKIKILIQFDIELSEDELRHMLELKTEIAVDNYARYLLKRSFDLL